MKHALEAERFPLRSAAFKKDANTYNEKKREGERALQSTIADR